MPGVDDLYGVEVTGYPAGWSVIAARSAITADITLLKPLLHDPDPAIRIHAAYALAAATDLDGAVHAAFRARPRRPLFPGPPDSGVEHNDDATDRGPARHVTPVGCRLISALRAR